MLQNELGLPAAVQSNEYVAEVYYTFRPDRGLEIRPNLQFVLDLGGTSKNKNALVFEMKTIENF